MNALALRQHGITMVPQSGRVILRPFIPSNAQRVTTIIGRALALTETSVQALLEVIQHDFESRHFDLEAVLLAHFERVAAQVFTDDPLSHARKLVIGGLFTGEYALESAALFNPSMVAHPDQAGVPEGCLRYILSLRATGEGHISSIEFRTGLLTPEGVRADPVSRRVALPKIVPDGSYQKMSFRLKLNEMGFDNEMAEGVLASLGDWFNHSELDRSMARIRREIRPHTQAFNDTLRCIQWLANSNYEMAFAPEHGLSERAIFPNSANESNGIEDARFVRFQEPDGSVMYYATYTAYNGHAILPQLIETQDFAHFRVLTLNGSAVQNKGMALFPRRVDGNYVMLSRQDDENLSIMFSDNPHYWSDPRILMRPAEEWESVKVGNCGSPMETEAGWLVMTHGVGPMRRYCIGAILLDLQDPTRVIGRLRQPLLEPEAGPGREGYVPNVVYSCGSIIHGREVIIPYAMSDRASTLVSVSLDELLAALRDS
jgi:predicted GH43/DUF377 family glycosyl hydrolase